MDQTEGASEADGDEEALDQIPVQVCVGDIGSGVHELGGVTGKDTLHDNDQRKIHPTLCSTIYPL